MFKCDYKTDMTEQCNAMINRQKKARYIDRQIDRQINRQINRQNPNVSWEEKL